MVQIWESRNTHTYMDMIYDNKERMVCSTDSVMSIFKTPQNI